jgi:hypothetical protein
VELDAAIPIRTRRDRTAETLCEQTAGKTLAVLRRNLPLETPIRNLARTPIAQKLAAARRHGTETTAEEANVHQINSS